MNRTVTLDLPAELLDHADHVAQQTGRTRDTVISAWLQSGAVTEEPEIFPVSANYPVYTPYGDEAVAQALLAALEADRVDENKTDQAS